MKENEKALEHVTSLIEDLSNYLPSVVRVEDKYYTSFIYTYKVSINNRIHEIIFDRSIIDDLEVALEKYAGTKYFDTLESNVKFNIYISLGKKDLLAGFNISHELINDKREWVKDYRVDTEFSPEMTDTFYRGLKKLDVFFESQIEKHKEEGLAYADIEDNKEWVQSLIDYYEEHSDLNSPGVGIKNLQFLKAAAIMQIIYLEKIKKSEKMPTTIKALDKKIYTIVSELRKDPLLEIKPPDFIHDIEEADE